MQLEKLGFRPNAKGMVSCLPLVTFLLSVLFMAMPGTAIAKSEDSPAATEFVVNINDNGEIIPVHTYTIDEMEALTSSDVVYYSSIDSMPAPNITIAKGVTLNALVDDMNDKYDANITITPTILEKIKLYATDGWASTYTNDYLYGATRYYYPELVNKWDEDNQKTGPGSDANPVEVQPIFATYSHQARFLTDLDPSQMLGPTDEGSTTFRFCFGQTEDEITGNKITNNRFGRWVNRMDIVLQQAEAPEIALDPNTKLGEDVVLTFEDNQTWREAISIVRVDDIDLAQDKYTVEAGKIIIDSSVFTKAKDYTIYVKASNYKATTVTQTMNQAPVQPLTPPELTADSIDNIVGNPVEITFTDNAAWRGTITEVKVGGTVLGSDKYTKAEGKITINAGVFGAAGDYTIVIKATGYEDVSVTQQIKEVVVEPSAPPVLIADSTDNTVGNAIDITFTDNAAWRRAITGVIVNGNTLQSDKYTVVGGKFTIDAGIFGAAGTYTIVIKAQGYKDVILVQQVKEIELITPPTLTADVTDNNVGHAIVITFTDDPVWRGAINEVTVDGASISGKYQVSNGKITINAGVFGSVKDYEIVVKASDYEDAIVTQNMVDPFQDWPASPTEPVPGGKTWTIRFSQPVSPTQSLKEHIYVTDAAGKRVDVTCEIEGHKSIKVVAPKEGYRSGASYTLWVKGSLQSATGKQLKQPVKLQFKIG